MMVLKNNLLSKVVLTLTVILLLSQLGYSQDKYYKRLNKKFQKAKYEKVLRKADRFINRNPANPVPYFFKAKTYLLLYLKTNEYTLLIKSIQNFNRISGKTIPEYLSSEVSELKEREMNVAKQAISESKIKKHSNKIRYLITRINNGSYKKVQNVNVSINPQPIELPRNKTRVVVVNSATKLIGTPYKYGGTTKKGFDCSGFTKYVYKFAGINLPRTANGQYENGKVVKEKNAKPGDLIVFSKNRRNKMNHVSIISKMRNGKIVSVIHSTSRGVIEDYVNDTSWQSYWKNRMKYIITYFNK